MVELLGVGASRQDGGWRLHRICASCRRGEVTLVVSRMLEERNALLDAVTARILPEEGRVWVAHVPVSRDTVRRIRAMVAEVDVHARPVEHRSLLWNVLVASKSVHRALHGRERLTVLASATTPAAASGFADRLVAIADGLLVFDGLPTDFSGQRVARRFGTV
jgi:hypothetical protein